MPTDTSSRCLWCGVAAGRAWYRTDVPCVVACERCPVVVTGDQAPGLAERPGAVDPEEALALLLRDLRASTNGLTTAEAQRRLLQHGPNQLRRHQGTPWWVLLGAQLTHPLALLLWAAAALSFAVGNGVIGIAIL